MSAVLKAHKIMRVSRAHPGVFARYHRGDPGFLDGLWNGIKGAATGFLTGGVGGAIVGGAAGIASGSRSSTGQPTGMLGSLIGTLTQRRTATMPGSGATAVTTAGLAAPVGIASQIPLPPLPPMPFSDPRGNTTQGGTSGTDWNDRAGNGTGTPCRSGFHYNKSGYFTKKYGYIEKGTVCVKNRKRNPLNPRAASRALSRLSSTRKAMKGIERLMHKIGGGSKRSSFGALNGKRGRSCKCR